MFSIVDGEGGDVIVAVVFLLFVIINIIINIIVIINIIRLG